MLKAILVDDEENSLNGLHEKINRHCNGIEVISALSQPAIAIEAINNLKPDILFLDIEMPGMNGFTLLQKLQHKNFELIFVTAYDHYAIKAIRYSALDYLVKPVEPDELKSAVDRAVEKRNSSTSKQQFELLMENITLQQKSFKRLAVPSYDGLHFVKIEDIIYLEAHVNYTHIHITNKQKYVVSRTIKDYEELLPADTFLRIHNSYIINKDFVERYIRGDGGQVVLSNGITLDVSKRKKTEFLKAIGY
ncbi:LytR/AlgR family response regulator transcription factor [Foetidibacter luteolus]|uniref:LytR/AlgR family response regulator transcription factor n=1 Tax=Foetidibacter luteolus TaxID=2608880 RepID=UPI00129A4717|nr:LytTR family DNA-binding domain-containing protein [Foetidibacter luteolus]